MSEWFHTGCGAYCDRANDEPCPCCRLGAEVERLTAELAERDRRIAAVRQHLDSCPMPPDMEDGWTRGEIDAWGAGIEYALQGLDALRGGS